MEKKDNKKLRIVTYPQKGERTADGEKLMRSLRHKKLRKHYAKQTNKSRAGLTYWCIKAKA